VSGAAHFEVDFPGNLDLEISHLPQVLPVAEGYQRWAPTYDDAPNPLLAREERYLTPLLSELLFKSVLDLACGTGRWLEKLMLLGCTSGVGIDSSAAMLGVADQKRLIRGRLTQAACEDLPLDSALFELAICSFALGHIHDLSATVSELKRVTKIGANVFISDLHPVAYQFGWRVGFRDRETPVQIEVQSRSTDEIVRAFSSNGFDCVSQQALWLGLPEQPYFARAVKLEAFEQACQLPAVFACRFRRIG